MSYQWWRIEAPHFCAGIQFGPEQTAIRGAPILRWAKGKTLGWMMDYCARRGWQMEPLRNGTSIDELAKLTE